MAKKREPNPFIGLIRRVVEAGDLTDRALHDCVVGDLTAMAVAAQQPDIRAVVKLYYDLQKFRVAADNREKQKKDEEPFLITTFGKKVFWSVERILYQALDAFTDQYAFGKWCKGLRGVGPAITAGLMAHLDIRRATVAGSFWSFAGMPPNRPWEEGKTRPFNMRLKRLCWITAGCFVSNKYKKLRKPDDTENDPAMPDTEREYHPDDYYGKLFDARKEYEKTKNARFEYREQAETAIKEKRVGKTTKAWEHYQNGQLPPGHLVNRAKRWTAKLFLSHVHHAMHVDFYGKEPSVPYVFKHCPGHSHFIPLPNWPAHHQGRSLRELLV